MKAPDQKLLQIAQLLSEERGLSQRDIFLRLDMAQGLVNRYLKLLAAKGWIKLTTAPAKRMRYWLTPKGMTEKSRLVLEFVTSNYRLYREAHRNASNALHSMARSGVARVAFLGGGPLAEIAALSLRENGQRLIGVIDATVEEAAALETPRIAIADLAAAGCEGVLQIIPAERAIVRNLEKKYVVASLMSVPAEAASVKPARPESA